eukprot:548032-Pleurochrysis_carterae.AAC.1
MCTALLDTAHSTFKSISSTRCAQKRCQRCACVSILHKRTNKLNRAHLVCLGRWFLFFLLLLTFESPSATQLRILRRFCCAKSFGPEKAFQSNKNPPSSMAFEYDLRHTSTERSADSYGCGTHHLSNIM